MAQAQPPDNVLAAILGATGIITRRVECWLPDLSAKLYDFDLPLVDGSITVSYSRTERRMFDLTINNSDSAIVHAIGQFWYDKVIKAFRGVTLPDGTQWEVQIGEFLMDKIQASRFPRNIEISGRDYTKKLVISKFAADTTFALGSSFDSVFNAIAINAGINPLKMVTPATGITLNTDYTISRNTTREKALTDMCNAYGYEYFFDGAGYMIRRAFQDPATAPVVWTYRTGPQQYIILPGAGPQPIGYPGHMVDFTKISGDSDLVNHWTVTGASTNTGLVYAEAINNNPDSPTSVQEIGDRSDNEDNPLLTTVAQCQARATALLATSALEDFEVDAETLVLAWLDVGDVVGFEDPSPDPGQATSYLLTDFDINMQLGTSKPVFKRVLQPTVDPSTIISSDTGSTGGGGGGGGGGGTATAPATPTAPSATAGNASATVTWVAPSNGGSVITGYTVTPFEGSSAQPATFVTGTTTATLVTGLANGTTYTFTVAASNAVGTSAPSPQSNAVLPSGGVSGPASAHGTSTTAGVGHPTSSTGGGTGGTSNVPTNVTAVNYDAGGALIGTWTAPTTFTPDHYLVQIDPPPPTPALGGGDNAFGPRYWWCTSACTWAKFSGGTTTPAGAYGNSVSNFANGTAYRIRVQSWSAGHPITTGGPANDGWSDWSATITPTYRVGHQGSFSPMGMFLPDGTPTGLPSSTSFTGGTFGSAGSPVTTTFNTDGQVINNAKFFGSIQINANGVIFQNCYFQWIGYGSVSGLGDAMVNMAHTGNPTFLSLLTTGPVFRNCEWDGGGAGGVEYIFQGEDSYELDHCNLHGSYQLCQSGYQANLNIHDCYLWDIAGNDGGAGSHNECSQIGNGSGTPLFTFKHNKMECYTNQVACIHCEGTNTGGTVDYEGNWFAGGGFPIYLSSPMSGTVSNNFWEVLSGTGTINMGGATYNFDPNGTGVYQRSGNSGPCSIEASITVNGNSWWGPVGGNQAMSANALA